MQLDIKSVNEGQSCKSVAMKFGIPRSTLVKKYKNISNDDLNKPLKSKYCILAIRNLYNKLQVSL